MKSSTHSIAEPMHGRHYILRAYVSRRTGKLTLLKAGCRRWKSFEEVAAHYAGSGRFISIGRWRVLKDTHSEDAARNMDRLDDYNARTGSLMAMCRLAVRVRKYQAGLKYRARGKKRRK